MVFKKRRDRPWKKREMRIWLVKLRNLDEPVEVEAEYRGMARHYVKCVVDQHMVASMETYKAVEWCRLKR